MKQCLRRRLIGSFIAVALLISGSSCILAGYWYALWPFSPEFVINTSPWTEPQLRAWAKLERLEYRYYAGTPSFGMAIKIKQSFVDREEEAENAFIKCLHSPTPSLRRATLNLSMVVSSAGISPTVGVAILETVDDADAGVRLAACRATGVLPREMTKPVLKRLLNSPEQDVREVAIEILGYGTDHEVAPWLIPLLKDSNPQIRDVTIHALKAIRDPSTIPAVEALASDHDPRVAASVEDFLKTMKEPPSPEIVK